MARRWLQVGRLGVGGGKGGEVRCRWGLGVFSLKIPFIFMLAASKLGVKKSCASPHPSPSTPQVTFQPSLSTPSTKLATIGKNKQQEKIWQLGKAFTIT